MHLKNNNTKIKSEIPGNVAKDLASTLQKEGYLIKRNFEYPNKISSTFDVKYRSYVLDIFAFKRMNDIVVIKYENCFDISSNKNKKLWKALSSKPGVNFHILVPSYCKEKAQMKSEMLNIPVKILCMDNWKDSLEFSSINSK
ncbi:MAG TPA: hypothetical protein VHO92_02725 [Methanobacterium sp.]|nr:hypothetical protein [Methanobacterium sp.]